MEIRGNLVLHKVNAGKSRIDVDLPIDRYGEANARPFLLANTLWLQVIPITTTELVRDPLINNGWISPKADVPII